MTVKSQPTVTFHLQYLSKIGFTDSFSIEISELDFFGKGLKKWIRMEVEEREFNS